MRAISLEGDEGWSKPKTLRVRYRQRHHLTIDSIMSYRYDHPGMVNIHRDKDLRRETSADQCQNDVKR
jgi:hypothetical protein